MSAQAANPELPRGAPETRRYKFGTPTALDKPVVGEDEITTLDYVNLAGANAIMRATMDMKIADVDDTDYRLDLLRDGRLVFSIYASQLARDLDFVPEVFPTNVSAGQYQWNLTQTKGTLAARQLTVTWQVRLV